MANGIRKLSEEELEDENGSRGNILSGILGLGAQIGGAVPGLRKGPERAALQAAQQGRGVGALTAKAATSQAARDALAVSAAGQGATKGLALRTGLRQAEQIRARGASQAAQIAAQESLLATRQLRENAFARRSNAFKLGTVLGGGLSTFAAARESQRQQTAPPPTPQETIQQALPTNTTGLSPAGGGLSGAGIPQGTTPQQQIINEGQQGLDRLRAARAASPFAGPPGAQAPAAPPAPTPQPVAAGAPAAQPVVQPVAAGPAPGQVSGAPPVTDQAQQIPGVTDPRLIRAVQEGSMTPEDAARFQQQMDLLPQV